MSPETMSAAEGTKAEQELTGEANETINALQDLLAEIQKKGTVLDLPPDELKKAKEVAQAYKDYITGLKEREPEREISNELIEKAEIILGTEAPSV